MSYNSFHPGQVWLDTEGKRIQAHGGSVILMIPIISMARTRKKQTERTESGTGE